MSDSTTVETTTESTATTDNTGTSTTTSTESTQQREGVLDSQTANIDFKSSLPEDLRNDPVLEPIKDVTGMAKSLISAQRMLGGRIPIPSEDASKEVIDEFNSKLETIPGVIRLPSADDPKANEKIDKVYDALGRPKTPEAYKLDIPSDLPIDEDYMAAAKAVAHKVGLNSSQLNALAKLETDRARQQFAVMEEQKKNVRSFLEKTWGNSFNENKAYYQGVMNKFSEKFPDAVKELNHGYAGNNPVVILMAAELGRVYAENGTIGIKSGTSSSRTPEQAKSQIADIMGNKDHAYHNHSSPGHDEAVSRVAGLYKDAYPDVKPSE